MNILMIALGLSCSAYLALCNTLSEGELIYLRDNVMAAEHPDVRDEIIEGYARKNSLSRDELSMRLVELAQSLNCSDHYQKTIHIFTVGSLRKFGTTNALDFLECEVLHGEEDRIAIYGYGTMVGFDGRLVDLSRKVVEQNVGTNCHRRGAVYFIMNYCLNIAPKEGVIIAEDNLLRIKDFLRSRIQTEAQHMSFLDQILCDADPTYSSSREREEALHRALNDPSITQMARDHLASIIARVEAEKNAKVSETRPADDPERRSGYGWIAVGAGVVVAAIIGWIALRRRG